MPSNPIPARVADPLASDAPVAVSVGSAPADSPVIVLIPAATVSAPVALLALPLLAAALLSPSPAAAEVPAALEEKLAVCTGCHGVDGVPVDASTPIIAGQEFYYLYVQLKDYQADRRSNPVMSGMVQDLEKEDMQVLAQHFADMPWPDVPSETDATVAAKGDAALGAGQCSQCHSTYQGDSRIPRLAGQQVGYLEQTMLDFKNKVRLNAASKGSLMSSFEDDQLRGMAHHLADL